MDKKDVRGIKLEDILGSPIIISRDKSTRIYGISNKNREVNISGYSESESRKGYFHEVGVTYLPESMYIINGNCTCEASKYYGMPCKHMLKLRNVYIKNRQKISR